MKYYLHILFDLGLHMCRNIKVFMSKVNDLEPCVVVMWRIEDFASPILALIILVSTETELREIMDVMVTGGGYWEHFQCLVANDGHKLTKRGFWHIRVS